MSEGDLTKTGSNGLDSILLGGIPKGNVILVQGFLSRAPTRLTRQTNGAEKVAGSTAL
jgi:KaiC/GvpD/RAD55 family RecA-like ATPase